MSTENTSGEESQPLAESASTETEAFNVDNIIGDILASKPASLGSSTSTPEEAGEPQGEEPENEVTQEAAPPAPAELKSAILAEKSRRERETRAEIESLKGSREQELADAQAAVVAELLENPQGFATKHGITEDAAADLALHFYAAGLGDDAPEDLRAQVGQSELERFKSEQKKELAALRAEMAQSKEIERNQTVLSQYSGLLADVPTDYPYLAVEASNDSQETLRTMAQVADAVYQRDGTYPSAIEVAKLIETEISAQVARYSTVGRQSPAAVKAAPQMTESVETETSNTLSTENLGRNAKRAPQGEDELFEDALAFYNSNLAAK